MQDEQHLLQAFKRAYPSKNGENLQKDFIAVYQLQFSYQANPQRAQTMWFEN